MLLGELTSDGSPGQWMADGFVDSDSVYACAR